MLQVRSNVGNVRGTVYCDKCGGWGLCAMLGVSEESNYQTNEPARRRLRINSTKKHEDISIRQERAEGGTRGDGVSQIKYAK